MTVLAFVFPLLFGATPGGEATTLDPGPAPVNKSLLLQLVNEVRKKGAKCGDTFYPAAPTLTWNSQLEQAALTHSSDMQANNFFSHASKDGRRAGDRIEAAGYYWRTYGENIAHGHQTEREVVNGWLLSPGHCKNMMAKAHKEMGVARVGDYWTQVLASK